MKIRKPASWAPCFTHVVPLFKPKLSTALFKTRPPLFALIQRRNGRQREIQQNWPSLRMSAGDHTLARVADYGNNQSSIGILPQGAYTVILRIKLRTYLDRKDQNVLLSEYGRKTCAEPGVIRCDVLFRVNKSGLATDEFYDIWITFADSQAYLEHERTKHAAKLRVSLENPSGGDSSMLLTKLAHQVSLLRPVLPAISHWISSFAYETDDSGVDENMPALGGSPKAHEDADKPSLNTLISRIGTEDVLIFIATAYAFSNESMRSLRSECDLYLKELEKSAGIVRTGVLVDKGDPFKIIMITVYDTYDKNGACFETELAADYVTDKGWTLRRYHSVFPDKVGWEKKLDEEQQMKIFGEIVEKEPEPDFSSPASLMKRERTNPEDPKLKLLQGPGAFDMLKEYIQKMTWKKTGQVKAMIICGWNASRSYPLLVGLEYDKRKDPIEINYFFGAIAYSTEITTKAIRMAMNEVARHQPDVIIGFGGGTVMDMAKLIARMGRASSGDVETYLTTIDGAAEAEAVTISLQVDSNPLPVVLISTTAGSGCELIEWCIVAGENKDKSLRRLPLYFADSAGTTRHITEKTIIQDSRLLRPKRLEGYHASQGALQLICLGIDTLITLHERIEDQAAQFALRGIKQVYKNVHPALVEPKSSSGETRDPIVNAKTMIGLAVDGAGRPGLCLKLCLATIDELVDGRMSIVFRMVLVRVTAAVLEELSESATNLGSEAFQRILQATEQHDTSSLALDMLRKAEDSNVRLLPGLGMVRRKIPEIASRVSGYMTGDNISPLESYLSRKDVLQRIMEKAIDQEYEL